MLKRTLVIIGTMSVMLLSGCGLLGGVSQEEMASVIAERDAYEDLYFEELEKQIAYEDEIESLKEEITTLEEEKSALEEEIDTVQSSGSSGDEMTVEAYYSQPFIKDALDSLIEEMKESYAGTYKDLGYEVSGNTFTYWFQYETQFDDVEAVAKQLESSITEEMLQGIVSDVEDECGVTGITCCYIYYNADGSIIYQNSYTSK